MAIQQSARPAGKAITLRNIPPAVRRAIRKKAEAEDTSLNKAALRLLEEAVRLPPSGLAAKKTLHRDLDALFGTWTEEEAREFDEALQEQRRVDPADWK